MMNANAADVRVNDERMCKMVSVVSALAALLPLVVFVASFKNLFWFGDDWDLTSDMARYGAVAWAFQPFAENFVPLFKLLWAVAIVVFGGSYFAMIVLIWITHAANVLLLGLLLGESAFGLAEILFVTLGFGLTWTNYESLAWATQWSQVLSVTFFLVAMLVAVRSQRGAGIGRLLAVFCAVIASAVCFSRGLLSGFLLAIYALLLDRSRFALPAVAAAGTVVMLVLQFNMIHGAGGAASFEPEHAGDIMLFGLYCFAADPLYLFIAHRPFDIQYTAAAVAVLGICKTAVIAVALWKTRGAARSLLVTLLVTDVLNCLLLGVGRFHTGLPAAVASRYQYVALICFLPFAAAFLREALTALRFVSTTRAVAWGLLLAGWVYLVTLHWQPTIGSFADWRGTQLRAALSSVPAGTRFGYALIDGPRARELAGRYHFH
jgi:hypothetical protein